MSKEKLKPCPFCGGEGQIKTEIDGNDLLAYIFCDNCCASTDKFIDVDYNGKNIDYAKKAWNRRTDNGKL